MSSLSLNVTTQHQELVPLQQVDWSIKRSSSYSQTDKQPASCLSSRKATNQTANRDRNTSNVFSQCQPSLKAGHSKGLSSPGEAVDVAAGDEKPPNEGVMLFPLVRLLKPLKPPPPFPKPENAVGGEAALAAAALKAKPWKPLKAPLLSPWNTRTQQTDEKFIIFIENNVNICGVFSQYNCRTVWKYVAVYSFTSDPMFLRLAFLIARFFNTSSLASENVPAWWGTTCRQVKIIWHTTHLNSARWPPSPSIHLHSKPSR